MTERVKWRALIVDDSALLRRTLDALFTRAGYSVELASNGEEAFRLLCQKPVDIVLTDVVMPDVDGVELIRLTRQDPFLRRLPVIAMSGHGGATAQARQAGATACLDKPVHAELVLALACRLLGDGRVKTASIQNDATAAPARSA